MNDPHLEFPFCQAFEHSARRITRRGKSQKPGLNPMAFTVALSNALRVYQLTHPIYDILVCVAHFQREDVGQGFATYPRIANALGCTFNNVQIHVSRNPDFFKVESGAPLTRLRLTQEAIDLLWKIKSRIDRTIL